MPQYDPGPPPGHPAWTLLNAVMVGLIVTAVSFFIPPAVVTFLLKLGFYVVLLLVAYLCGDVAEHIAESYQCAPRWTRVAWITGYCVPFALLLSC